MALKIAITPSQQFEMRALFDQATVACDEGKPGMVIAQVFPDGLHVGFLPHDFAVKVIKALKESADLTLRCRSIDDVGKSA